MDYNDKRLTLPKLRNFFFRLPYNSQTRLDMAGISEEARPWDINTYMLANVIDILLALDWHTVAAHSKSAPKPPKPFPRPDVNSKPKTKPRWPGKTIVSKGVKNG